MSDCLIDREVCTDAPARCWAPSCTSPDTLGPFRNAPEQLGTEANTDAS